MTPTDTRGLRALLPLLALSVVVVLVALGFARGVWLSNLHNGLLALAMTAVGAYVLFQRPRHREGLLLLAAGAVEAVMFLGRQVAHSEAGASPWWGWLGVWPLAVALALTTMVVLCFPDGHLPSPRWQAPAAAIGVVALVCAGLSALWPVEYASAGVTASHPISPSAPDAVTRFWTVLAHPSYVASQLVWVVALTARWRSSGALVRRQLGCVAAVAAVSVLALVTGLLTRGTPVPGLVCAALLPVAAGWAIVHGQHVAAYSALSWLSRTGPEPEDLPTDIARVTAEALSVPTSTLWMGTAADLRAVGLWPETDAEVAPTRLEALRTASSIQVRPVTSNGRAVGALSIERLPADRLSLTESRLFDDLAAQAALVLDHLNLSEVITQQRRTGRLEGLTPREQDVLELMSQGLSNAAISEELHLSIKTVEPVVGAIFVKLGLHQDTASNRRVLAVLAFVRA